MKKEHVLVAGCNGYIGNALTQALLFRKYNVIGIDSDIKHKWTQDLGSQSIIPLELNTKKESVFKKISKFKYLRIDICNEPIELKKLLSDYRFSTIVNLAQQPSAAWSHASLKNATETLFNNNIGTLNMLWAINELKSDTHYIEIESMGCYQPDIGIEIPEGDFLFIGEQDDIPTISAPSLFPRRPGSLYHASKVFNSYLVDCANRWWDLKITAVNQGIVFGNYTEEIEETKIHSPLWIDECFGTIVNRFIAQNLMGHPLTIYGKGRQKRGFLSLSDSIQALILLIENPPNDRNVRFVNQIGKVYAVLEIAHHFKNSKIDFMESPRVENTSDFYYKPKTRKLNDLGFKPTVDLNREIEFANKHISIEILNKCQHLILPKIKWKK